MPTRSGIMTYEDIAMFEKKWKDELSGGKADKSDPSDFDPEELVKGSEHEKEHTDDVHKSMEISMDHLKDDPKYYDKLAKIEKESSPAIKPIRGKAAQGDPTKLAKTNVEAYHTKNGSYFIMKGNTGRYSSIFVNSTMDEVQPLGDTPDRKSAIDSVLAHHDKTAAGIGESSVWPQLGRLLETLDEIDHEEFDYPKDQIHPHLQAQRDQLKQALSWVADGLEKSGSGPAADLGKELRKIPDLPSDQIMGKLQQIQKDAWKIKNQLKKNPSNREDVANAQKTIDNAITGLPSVMKAAATLGKSGMTDKGLWQKGVKGRWDDEAGFIPKSTYTYPTGAHPKDVAAKSAAADQAKSRQSFSQRIAPQVNKGGAPKDDPSVKFRPLQQFSTTKRPGQSVDPGGDWSASPEKKKVTPTPRPTQAASGEEKPGSQSSKGPDVKSQIAKWMSAHKKDGDKKESAWHVLDRMFSLLD